MPCGFISTTGVAGLTLGGGIGYLSRRYGLTIDNLLSVDMVLADGRCHRERQGNADLFWALRGGGGNFGVVTSFEFRMHPVSTVQFGPTFWPLEESADVLKAYREFILDSARGSQRLLCLSGGPAGANVSRAPAYEKGLRHCLVRHGHSGRNGGGDQHAQRGARCSIPLAPRHFRWCRALSTACFFPACSGTGAPTTSPS